MMKRPALVGIVNMTPDSFSGDGQYGQDALAYARCLADAGADILDIGAESTRPGARSLSAEEEWGRLQPFLMALSEQPWRQSLRVSLDTRHITSARQALEYGVEIINDVSGLVSHDMCELLGEHTGDIMVMHSLSLPADPTIVWPDNCEPVAEILAWKEVILRRAVSVGIMPERLIFDPGIGFGKTPGQSLALMLGAQSLVASGGRWLFGHSRKSFLQLFSDAPAAKRDDLTLAFSAMLAEAGVPYLRVHQVARHHTLFEQLCR